MKKMACLVVLLLSGQVFAPGLEKNDLLLTTGLKITLGKVK